MSDELIIDGLTLAEFRKIRAERDELRIEVQRLRTSVLNQCADNVCWFSDPAAGRALPEAEFLESCRRYRQQIADGNGEYAGGLTIAQLEAEVERLRTELGKDDRLEKSLLRDQRNENLRLAQKAGGDLGRSQRRVFDLEQELSFTQRKYDDLTTEFKRDQQLIGRMREELEREREMKVLTVRLKLAAQEQRDELMVELGKLTAAAPPAPVSAAGVVACEADPLIIAEIIHFLEGCAPPPNIFYPVDKWIKELAQLYKPGWQPEPRISYPTGADMTLETARARAVALEDGFREVTKVLASYGAELEQLRKRRDELIEANNRLVEERRSAEERAKRWAASYGEALTKTRKTEVSLNMLRDFLETIAAGG